MNNGCGLVDQRTFADRILTGVDQLVFVAPPGDARRLEAISGMKTLYGINLIVSPSLAITDRVQFRFPRSKKARIRKKWSKRQENFKSVHRDQCFKMGNTIVCSPGFCAKIQKDLQDSIDSEFLREQRIGGGMF
jgi:hypothetical protein